MSLVCRGAQRAFSWVVNGGAVSWSLPKAWLSERTKKQQHVYFVAVVWRLSHRNRTGRLVRNSSPSSQIASGCAQTDWARPGPLGWLRTARKDERGSEPRCAGAHVRRSAANRGCSNGGRGPPLNFRFEALFSQANCSRAVACECIPHTPNAPSSICARARLKTRLSLNSGGGLGDRGRA